MAMVFGPSTSDTLHVKASLLTVAATPLHVTEATAERASVTVPVIVSAGSETIEPAAGAVIVTTGGVVSSVTCTLAGVCLSLESVATAVIVFGPSPAASVIVAVHAPFVS